MTAKMIQITVTCASLDEARKICRYLVQERLVACAQIVPWIESIFMWNNQLETNQESRITLKTSFEHWEKVKEMILKNHSYQIPEITFSTIEGGNEAYMRWMEESCGCQI